jgi:hypothetical protein
LSEVWRLRVRSGRREVFVMCRPRKRAKG